MIVCIACKKDKFNTTPSLKLKSISSKVIPVNSDMQVELEFTDKQGDLAGDTLMFIKVRNNERATLTTRDTLNLALPDFPEKNKGLLELALSYQNFLISAVSPPTLPGGGNESDSLTMKFILKDNASHHSDTLVINDIVIER
jgi:hypothetical protein